MKTKHRSAYDEFKYYRVPKAALQFLSDGMGVPFNTLYKALNGNTPISAPTAQAISDYSENTIPIHIITNPNLSLDELNSFLYNHIYRLKRVAALTLEDIL